MLRNDQEEIRIASPRVLPLTPALPHRKCSRRRGCRGHGNEESEHADRKCSAEGSSLPIRPGRLLGRVADSGRSCLQYGERCSFDLPQAILEHTPPVRQSVFLLASAGLVGDCHLGGSFGKCSLHVFLGQVRSILQAQTPKSFRTCTLTVQAANEVSWGLLGKEFVTR